MCAIYTQDDETRTTCATTRIYSHTQMEKWAELRTAYHVAKLGTVSAAADALNIHRATVLRHVEVLEAELGGTLFHRHARGYTPTDAGRDLLRVAAATEDQFRQLAGRTRGRAVDVSGEIVVTTVEIVAPLIMPAIERFRANNPNCTVRFEVSDRVLRLEYGEAHVAIRGGSKPDDPDGVVRPFFVLRSGLYAHRRYVQAHGLPRRRRDYGKHLFVCDGNPSGTRAPARWLREHVPDANIVFASETPQLCFLAIRAGLGIGFCPEPIAVEDADLVEVVAPKDRWNVGFWLVTHMDLHRTQKVQSFLRTLEAVEASSP